MEFTKKSYKVAQVNDIRDLKCALFVCTYEFCTVHCGRMPAGPLCMTCKRQITGFKRMSIMCTGCGLIYHRDCQQMSKTYIRQLNGTNMWKCIRCTTGLPLATLTPEQEDIQRGNRARWEMQTQAFLHIHTPTDS
jgi:hypothetical protein